MAIDAASTVPICSCVALVDRCKSVTELNVPLKVAEAVAMLELTNALSANWFNAVAADGINSKMASMASDNVLFAEYTPPDLTGLLLFSVGVLSNVSVSCLPFNSVVSCSLVGKLLSFVTSPLVMPLLIAAHCAAVKPLLFNLYSNDHASPLNL